MDHFSGDQELVFNDCTFSDTIQYPQIIGVKKITCVSMDVPGSLFSIQQLEEVNLIQCNLISKMSRLPPLLETLHLQRMRVWPQQLIFGDYKLRMYTCEIEDCLVPFGQTKLEITGGFHTQKQIVSMAEGLKSVTHLAVRATIMSPTTLKRFLHLLPLNIIALDLSLNEHIEKQYVAIESFIKERTELQCIKLKGMERGKVLERTVKQRASKAFMVRHEMALHPRLQLGADLVNHVLSLI